MLLLIYPRNGIPHVVFTRRTENLGRHQGQISLPGGSRDPEDPTLEATALRETEEEIGVPAGDVELWGRVDDVYVQISNFLIAPYVGALAYEPCFSVNSAEVAYAIEVPVDVLRDPAIFGEGELEIRGELRRVQCYQYGAHQIWGATARIVELFLVSPFAKRASEWLLKAQPLGH